MCKCSIKVQTYLGIERFRNKNPPAATEIKIKIKIIASTLPWVKIFKSETAVFLIAWLQLVTAVEMRYLIGWLRFAHPGGFQIGFLF